MTTTRIREITREVIEAHEGVIGTHYENCWKRHAGCLAVLISEYLEEP